MASLTWSLTFVHSAEIISLLYKDQIGGFDFTNGDKSMKDIVTGETARQLSERFGKIMQDRSSVSINQS